MIKCNRCGNMTIAGAAYCQSCGAPLSSDIDLVGAPNTGAQEQPELPAWLESLRAGERYAAPAQSPSSFSAADLVEEGALPSWMRAERDNTASHPPVSLPPSALPGPTTGEDVAYGINAQSLVDEQALPAWMQEGKLSSAPSVPDSGFAASSLIQPDALPDWMKRLQPPEPTRQAPAPGPVSPARPVEPLPSVRGFSAHDLIDQQSLPSWMAQQSGSLATPPPQGDQAGLPPQAGFAASSLLDVDSLPPWLREGGQEQVRQNNAPPSPTWQPVQSNQAWSPSPQADQAWQMPSGTAPEQGGGLNASSFIDPNALPAWLRNANEQGVGAQPPQQNMAGSPGAFAVPPRVENVRVPSRPRNEGNPNEGSEVAANVFASMLGVASTASNYPAPVPPSQYQQQPAQGNQPWQPGPLGAPSPGAGSMPNTPASMPGAQMPGYSVNQPAGFGGYPANNQNYPINNQNYQMNAPYVGGQPNAGNPNRNQSMPGTPGATKEQKNANKPARRGIFESIREWFER